MQLQTIHPKGRTRTAWLLSTIGQSLFFAVSSFALSLTPPITTRVSALTSAPPFDQVGQYTTTIPVNQDLADIYYPNPTDLGSSNYGFPIVLLLQGALVDKSFYSDYATQVARYGFVVVVPNHFRPFSVVPGNPPALLSETSQLDAVLAHIQAENESTTSPIAGVVDTQKLGLLGHSFGGAVGLSAIANQCLTFLCREPFTRPPELLAGVFYGTNLRDQITNEFIPIQNDGIAIALLQGDRDGVALPFRAANTFANIATPPKLLLSVEGANHFGITNVNNPANAQPDLSQPTLDQQTSIETIARWSGLFLQSSLLNNPSATEYIFFTGDADDPNVTLVSASIPEPSVMGGVLLFGAFSVASQLKRHQARTKNWGGGEQN